MTGEISNAALPVGRPASLLLEASNVMEESIPPTESSGSGSRHRAISTGLEAWLIEATGDPGPFELRALSGGNSNETLLLTSPSAERVIRRPPSSEVDASAHNMGREATILGSLARTAVPTPDPLGLCESEGVPEAPFLLMERVEGVSILESLPPTDAPGKLAGEVGGVVIDALADLHSLPWRELGLDGFGHPEGFLDRQVGRWRKQYARYQHRELADFGPVADWLEANQPPEVEAGILHGDFHVDNCLLTLEPEVRVRAVLDWEMSTIGDPLVDVGLILALWGSERPDPPAMPAIQGFSRIPGTPGRSELADRYERRSGRSLEHLDYYMALALWKLAAIVEGAYSQFVAGEVDSEYAAALEYDVPRLLAQARAITEPG